MSGLGSIGKDSCPLPMLCNVPMLDLCAQLIVLSFLALNVVQDCDKDIKIVGSSKLIRIMATCVEHTSASKTMGIEHAHYDQSRSISQ